MSVIDVWSQITTARMGNRPWLQTLMRWNGQTENFVSSVDATLQEMDKAGVDISLLSAWYGPEGDLISNEEVAEQIATAPARFRGLASADLTRPMEAVREIRRWVDGKRFVGVRVVPWLWGLPPNNRLYYPIYAACIEAGVPFCTQIGHTGPLKGSDTGRLIPYLEEVMLDFPELVVVGGHVGFPWIDELVTMTVKFPNFHVDTSAYALHRLPPAFVDWMKGIGQRRVMFGSNWQMLSPATCLKGLGSLTLSPEASADFLSGNAKRVFGL
ncbi:amidohydrolase family protein [Rhodopseudomonas parapalustris]